MINIIGKFDKVIFSTHTDTRTRTVTKKKIWIRIVGDTHGNYSQFEKLIQNCENVIQLGDFGFEYSSLERMSRNTNIKIISGNHDNYDLIPKYSQYFLGDYGCANIGRFSSFFVRGGFSIDKRWRLDYTVKTGIKCWWEKEQLDIEQHEDCIKLYGKIKPSIILSHSCPYSIAKTIGNPATLRYFGFNPDTFITTTQDLLQNMLQIYRPKLWIFAHHHKHFDQVINGTRFICLEELKYIDFNQEGEMICV